MRVVAFLPAKGSSERIPHKNTKLLAGEPLLVYTLKTLLSCPSINEVYLDSEDPSILEMGKWYGATPLPRDPSLSTNETDGHALFHSEVTRIPNADIYIQALCTSPFLGVDTIEGGIQVLKDSGEIDSITLISSHKDYYWDRNRYLPYPNSQDLPWTHNEGMNLYLVKGAQSHRIGQNPRSVKGTPQEMIDIDTPEDWSLAENIMLGVKQRKQTYLNTLKPFLSTSILHDAGARVVLESGGRSTPKLFGPCKPLIIGIEGEDIYSGYHTYQDLTPGEVLFIHNRTNTAYFGTINSHLALQAGVQGVIINGLTRDTEQLHLPVWYQHSTPRDCREKGKIQSWNQPLYLNGTMITPGDILFSDQDGVVHLPWREERGILHKALGIIEREGWIHMDIIRNINPLPSIAEYA